MRRRGDLDLNGRGFFADPDDREVTSELFKALLSGHDEILISEDVAREQERRVITVYILIFQRVELIGNDRNAAPNPVRERREGRPINVAAREVEDVKPKGREVHLLDLLFIVIDGHLSRILRMWIGDDDREGRRCCVEEALSALHKGVVEVDRPIITSDICPNLLVENAERDTFTAITLASGSLALATLKEPKATPRRITLNDFVSAIADASARDADRIWTDRSLISFFTSATGEHLPRPLLGADRELFSASTAALTSLAFRRRLNTLPCLTDGPLITGV